MMVGGGGIGGIIASNAFQQKDAPNYLPGINTALASQVRENALLPYKRIQFTFLKLGMIMLRTLTLVF